MQHLNDDMDELFRKAADDYPLNTDAPDWNWVAKGLSEDKSPEASPREKKYRRFLWLLLLLPLGFVISEIVNPNWFKSAGSETGLGSDTGQPPGNNEGSTSEEINTEITARSKDKITPAENGTIGSDATLSAEKTRDNKESAQKTQEENKRNQENEINQDNKRNHENKSNRDGNTSLQKADNGIEVSKIKKEIAGGSKSGTTGNPGVANSRLTPDSGLPRDVKQQNNGNTVKHSGSANKIEPISPSVENSVVPDREGSLPSHDLPPGNDLIDAYTDPALIARFERAQITAAAPAPLVLPLGTIKRQQTKNKNFYVGAIGGFDITTISFQQTSKIGNHYGAMAGYSFARKWSVEVGFIVDKKYYYSDGRYFDRTKLNLNPNTTIISVDGECRMFEIPISIKYDITDSYKANFFVTAGLSSYIMKQEDYKMVWGYASGSRGTHYYPYKNSSKNLFAELRLTTGYSVKLTQNFSFRVEPYVNIPLAGVGYGKLNLMSAGLNAGIFKRIF